MPLTNINTNDFFRSLFLNFKSYRNQKEERFRRTVVAKDGVTNLALLEIFIVFVPTVDAYPF